MTDKEFLSLTDIEKQQINSAMEYCKHKLGMSGIEAFLLAVDMIFVARNFDKIILSLFDLGMCMNKFTMQCRSICNDGTRQVDNN